MSIKEKLEKIKSLGETVKRTIYDKESGLQIKDDIYVVILIIFVGLISFGLGKLSAYEKTTHVANTLSGSESSVATAFESMFPSASVNIPAKETAHPAAVTKNIAKSDNGVVFASKSGKRYYYPDCSSRVKEANKIWFQSIEEAESAGLTLASGCTK